MNLLDLRKRILLIKLNDHVDHDSFFACQVEVLLPGWLSSYAYIRKISKCNFNKKEESPPKAILAPRAKHIFIFTRARLLEMVAQLQYKVSSWLKKSRTSSCDVIELSRLICFLKL